MKCSCAPVAMDCSARDGGGKEGRQAAHRAQALRYLHIVFVNSASELRAALPDEHHGVEDAHVGCFAEADDGRKRGRLLVNTEHATGVVSEGGRHRAGGQCAGVKSRLFEAAAVGSGEMGHTGTRVAMLRRWRAASGYYFITSSASEE